MQRSSQQGSCSVCGDMAHRKMSSRPSVCATAIIRPSSCTASSGRTTLCSCWFGGSSRVSVTNLRGGETEHEGTSDRALTRACVQMETLGAFACPRRSSERTGLRANTVWETGITSYDLPCLGRLRAGPWAIEAQPRAYVPWYAPLADYKCVTRTWYRPLMQEPLHHCLFTSALTSRSASTLSPRMTAF